MNQQERDLICLTRPVSYSVVESWEADVLEAWTDEAREAALEARRSHMKAKEENDPRSKKITKAAKLSHIAHKASEEASKLKTADSYGKASDAHFAAKNAHYDLDPHSKLGGIHSDLSDQYLKASRGRLSVDELNKGLTSKEDNEPTKELPEIRPSSIKGKTVIFHGSAGELVDTILKTGLQPKKPFSNPEVWGMTKEDVKEQGLDKEPKGVYGVTSDSKSALTDTAEYGLAHSGQHEAVVFEAEINSRDAHEDLMSNKTTKAIYTTKVIPPTSIRAIHFFKVGKDGEPRYVETKRLVNGVLESITSTTKMYIPFITTLKRPKV